MGAGLGREWIHVYVWLSPFTSHLKPSQHCWMAILQCKIENYRKTLGHKHIDSNRWKTPNRVNPKKTTPRHIIVKYQKTEDKGRKEKNVVPEGKTQFEGQQISHQKPWRQGGNGVTFFKCWKKMLINKELYFRDKYTSERKEILPDEEKLKGLLSSWLTLKEWLEEFC